MDTCTDTHAEGGKFVDGTRVYGTRAIPDQVARKSAPRDRAKAFAVDPGQALRSLEAVTEVNGHIATSKIPTLSNDV